METENRKKSTKTSKFIFVCASLVVLTFVTSKVWKSSGSGEWELELEKNGVEVFSMKSPGSSVKQYKGVMQSDYSLNHLVAGLIENSTLDNCKNNIPNCVDLQVLDEWDANLMSDTVLWKLELFPPLKPREILIRSHVNQDEVTKVVSVDIYGAPNRIPRNENTVRLSYIQNKWVYTPVAEGQTQIEFYQDMNMGGLFPDFLLNLAGADETYKFLHDQLPGLLNNDGLSSKKYDFIAEL